MAFTLHAQLRADCIDVVDLPVCTVLLMNDTRFTWCVLVPRIEGARELHHLAQDVQQQIWQEVSQVSMRLEALVGAHKMNIAALGNLVPQLHIHVIARFESDATWPSPVWGFGTAQPYEVQAGEDQAQRIRAALTA